MRPPPGPPTTMNSLPSRVMIVGVIEDSGRFAGLDRVRLALHQSEHVRRSRLRGEIVHLVVQQKPEPRRGDSAAVTAVQRVSHAHRIPRLVDDGKMRRFGTLDSLPAIPGRTVSLLLACSGSMDDARVSLCSQDSTGHGPEPS